MVFLLGFFMVNNCKNTAKTYSDDHWVNFFTALSLHITVLVGRYSWRKF